MADHQIESGYPHDDDRCRQNSVDAEGFREAARQVARLADALGLADTGQSIGEMVDAAIRRLDAREGVASVGLTSATGVGTTPPPASPEGVFLHDDHTECRWSLTDQRWYRLHPLYPLTECTREHVFPPEVQS